MTNKGGGRHKRRVARRARPAVLAFLFAASGAWAQEFLNPNTEGGCSVDYPAGYLKSADRCISVGDLRIQREIPTYSVQDASIALSADPGCIQ